MKIVNLGLVILSLFTCSGWAADKPNIVFVLVDDLRLGTMSCEGHPFSKTPNLDRLAREGAMFRNAYVTTPLCSPSRGSFLTGQYAHRHQVIDNADFQKRSHELVTFPMLLRGAGYETAYVGKWHMGNHDEPKPGYDHWVSFKGQGVYENPMINVNGKAQKIEGYMTDILSDHAVEFLKREHQKPFVLCVGHKAVHGPFTPAPRHKNLYAGEPLPKAPPSLNDALEGKPAVRQMRESQAKGGRPADTDQIVKRDLPTGLILAQLRSLKSIDEGIGKMLAALEETKQLDNTLFIFTSDNGYFWGEHGLGDKRWAYEESVRIPLLMRFPKMIKAGSQPKEMTLNVDIAPTLLELGGANIPDSMQGRSLVPVLKGNTRNWREAVFLEYFVDRQYPRFPKWQAVSSGDWKYIHYPEVEGMDELYDLESDPHELENLVDSKKRTVQSRLRKLRAELSASAPH
jgi:arylsulfatase A-like enzyme